MRAVIISLQTDSGLPLVHQFCVMSRAQMIGMIIAAWKYIPVDCAAAAVWRRQDSSPRRFKQFERERTPGLFLYERNS